MSDKQWIEVSRKIARSIMTVIAGILRDDERHDCFFEIVDRIREGLDELRHSDNETETDEIRPDKVVCMQSLSKPSHQGAAASLGGFERHLPRYFPPIVMTTNSKNTEAAGVETPELGDDAKHSPEKSFHVDDVHASVFARVNQGKTFRSVSFSRSYRDKAGKKHFVRSFDPKDLDSLVEVIRQSVDYLKTAQS